LYYNRGFTDMTADADSKVIKPGANLQSATSETSTGVISNMTIRLGVMF
jgi:hypothetical protein